MRHAPNQIDLEAAKLFRHAGGMLMAWQAESGKWWWERVADHEVRDATSTWRGMQADALAIAADDPATEGVMLAQLREVSGDPYGFVAPWVADNRDIPVEWRYARDPWFPDETCGPAASTYGGALVAAMRALKSTTTP